LNSINRNAPPNVLAALGMILTVVLARAAVKDEV
jgi:hypothetical protein